MVIYGVDLGLYYNEEMGILRVWDIEIGVSSSFTTLRRVFEEFFYDEVR